MLHSAFDNARGAPVVSPLILCDRLLTLAADADFAGLRGTAEQLLQLASTVLDQPNQWKGIALGRG